MLELPLVKGDPFHHVLEAILDLSDVAHVVCTRRGLNLQAVDTKRAAIVSLLFPAEDFKGYTCDEYISMGIQSATWSRPSAAATRKTPSPSRSAKKTSAPLPYHSCRPKSTVDYEFRLVDAELARFELPDRQFLGSKYQGSVKMPSVEFRRICKYLSLISVTDEDLTFFAKGTNGDVYMYKQSAGVVGGALAISKLMPAKYKHMLGGPSLKVDPHTGAVAELLLTFTITLAMLWIIVRGPRNPILKT
ncbi:hypothetical protein U9M48_000159 [Paspalum notatum var. saurae]|uniref:Proliferating cell nuclear antigen PCNA N-terminal domain-containing protein n=1 Tax=Paspalum notatum var. saurae TaxID=547442 RepID=A0AAQ3PKX6_PASNO